MTPVLVAVYALPPLVAILLSRRAKSQFVRKTLYSLAVFCLIAFAILQLAQWDCTYTDFSYEQCGTLPDVIARMLGYFHILYSIAYLFAGPVFLVFAAIVEMVVRSKV